MACECKQTFTGSAADLFATIQTEVGKHGGTVTGDAAGGTFSVPAPLGKAAGSYTIDGQNQKLDVTFTHTPLGVGCGTICNFIKNNIG